MKLKNIVNKNMKNNTVNEQKQSTARDYYYTLQRSPERSLTPCQIIYDDNLVDDELSDKLYIEKHPYRDETNNTIIDSWNRMVYPNYHINSTKQFKSVRQVETGEYVVFDNVYYLVLNSILNGGAEYILTVVQCNYLLKWINPNGVIFERWVAIGKNASYNKGIDDFIPIPTSDAEIRGYFPRIPCIQDMDIDNIKVFVSFNSNATETHPNGQPFVFKITQFNDMDGGNYNSGYISIIAQQVDYDSSRDDIQNLIANRYLYEKQYELILNISNDNKIIMNNNEEYIINSYINATDKDGNVSNIGSQDIQYEIVSQDDENIVIELIDNKIISLNDNGFAKIRCYSEMFNIEKILDIEVQSEDIVTETNIQIDGNSNIVWSDNKGNTTLTWNQKNEYEIKTFVNGLYTDDDYEVSLTTISGNSDDYDVLYTGDNIDKIVVNTNENNCKFMVNVKSKNHKTVENEVLSKIIIFTVSG